MFLRQRWHDHRLKYAKIPGISHLELDTKVIKNVWVPDLFFNNEKKADIHDVTVPNMLMHIYPDGDIVYSMRYVLSIGTLTGLMPPYFCACLTPRPGFPTSYVVIIFMLNDLSWEVIFCFVDFDIVEIFKFFNFKKNSEFSLIDDEVRVFRINIKLLSNPVTELKIRENDSHCRSIVLKTMDRSIVKQLEKEKNSNYNVENFVVMFIY
jgi:hypothetical protein